MLPSPIRDHFEQQAKACDSLGSPFTARLCRLLGERLDRSTVTGLAVAEWPGSPRADALALRLCGGLHQLVLSGADEELASVYPPQQADDATLASAVMAAIVRNDEDLVRFLESPPQTNEIARAAMVLPGLLLVARRHDLPLAVAEIGASAGLNLNLDRFRFDYGAEGWGDPASPVRISPEVRGEGPPLAGALDIAARAGCDISPIDVSRAGEAARLRSYVWPDQQARLERIDAAIEIALAHPFALELADAAAFVRERLAARPKGATFVLMHTIMWQYMPRATKDAILAALAEAGETATPDAPILRLRMEPRDPKDHFATLSLTSWPGGVTERLAHCDFHGRWIEWLGPRE